MRLALAILLLCVTLARGAGPFYVRDDGADTNDGLANVADAGGTSGQAWLTIQKAASTLAAGETVYVRTGTYNEHVTISADGNSGAWINFVADTSGAAVITRRWTFDGANYIRMIGFEVTHSGQGTTYTRAITANGTTSHIDIIDNYIHDTTWDGFQSSDTATYITIRGNRFLMMGTPDEEPCGAKNCISNNYINPQYWLVEYNHGSRMADFADLYGAHHIARNNQLDDISLSYWSGGAPFPHPDLFQPGSDGNDTGAQDHVYEANWNNDSIDPDAHFGIWQNQEDAGDTNMIIRGNVAAYAGSGIGNIGTEEFYVYNQSFHKMCQDNPEASAMLGLRQNSGGNEPSGFGRNNVISDKGLGGNSYVIYIDDHEASDGTFTFPFSNNWGYLASTHASYVGTSDPLFTDGSQETLDLRLQSGSPLRGAGVELVTATENVTATTFDVSNAAVFSDGNGIAEGDIVVINGTTTRITDLDTGANTMTVATSVTVTTGMPIYWNRRGEQKDIGAYPFGATFLTAATYTTGGTVTPTGDARKVWQYRAGIPIAEDYDAPFTFSHQSGDVYKVYALYAQATPVVTATLAGDTPMSGRAGRRSGNVRIIRR